MSQAKEASSKRASEWFSAFVKSTTEKSRTLEILEKLISTFIREAKLTGQICNVLDVGVGDGVLSEGIAKLLKDLGLFIHYSGIDFDTKFVKTTSAKLQRLGIEGNIIQGDCFSDDLNKLPDHPSFILASHVAYYGDVELFVNSLIKKMGVNTISILIHAPTSSNHMKIRQEFGCAISIDVTSIIKSVVQERGMYLREFSFPSSIHFPLKPILIPPISESDYSSTSAEPEIKLTRNLLEFIPQGSLEEIKNPYAYCIKIIQALFLKGRFEICTNVQIIAHKDNILRDHIETALEALLEQSEAVRPSLPKTISCSFAVEALTSLNIGQHLTDGTKEWVNKHAPWLSKYIKVSECAQTAPIFYICTKQETKKLGSSDPVVGSPKITESKPNFSLLKKSITFLQTLASPPSSPLLPQCEVQSPESMISFDDLLDSNEEGNDGDESGDSGFVSEVASSIDNTEPLNVVFIDTFQQQHKNLTPDYNWKEDDEVDPEIKKKFVELWLRKESLTQEDIDEITKVKNGDYETIPDLRDTIPENADIFVRQGNGTKSEMVGLVGLEPTTTPL